MLSALTPLIIGFFSGFHCVAMCGGLCAVICQKQNTQQTLITNLGRVFTYTLLGAIFAGVIQGASLNLDLAAWGLVLRIAMGLMLLLSGLALILKNKSKWLVINKPLPFWPKIAARLKQIQQADNLPMVFFKGVLWGLIPCGLLYGMLIIAATTADMLRGASFMLFFGLGTIMPLLLSQRMIQKLVLSNNSQKFRIVSGGFVLILGLWVLLSPWFAHYLIPENNRFFTELGSVLNLCLP